MPKRSRRTTLRACAIAYLSAAGSEPFYALAADKPIEQIDVTGARLAEPAARRAFGGQTFDARDLQTAPQTRLDTILSRIPGVGLFRRASSLVAHPTTQGLTLRAIAPNGAGRALVLLDGVPLNDPFGGWVYWSALAPEQLERVDVIPGSGTGPYGNQALSGTVRLFSRQPSGFEAWGKAEVGTFETVDLSAGFGNKVGPVSFSLSGQAFDTDGFFLQPKDQRGPVDVPASSDTQSLTSNASWQISKKSTLGAHFGWFEEDRINGTSLARNNTRALDASLSLVVDGGQEGPSLQFTAYWRDRDFANSFAAVLDDERTLERAVLDQFDVPAWGAGGSGLIRFPIFDDDSLELGFDIRRQSGETNERARNLGDGFTRIRRAGGDQWLLGSWLEFAGSIAEKLSLAGGLRLDHWRVFNGFLTEEVLADGTLLRDDAIEKRNDTLINGRLAGTYDVTSAVAVSLSGYSSYRLPTINEFYRPFRVGNDITEANPELETERLYGLEAGLAYEPLNSVHVSFRAFRNWLDRGVGNVTIALGPGFFPPTNFVPAGGSLRQRQNIDHIIADGLEIKAEIGLSNRVRLSASYLYTDARITGFRQAPELVGKRLAQSPKHGASLALSWAPGARWDTRLEARYAGKRFEDDLNERVLDDDITLAAYMAYDLSEHSRLFLRGENLLDQRIESRIGGDGLITRASPRRVSGGIRFRY